MVQYFNNSGRAQEVGLRTLILAAEVALNIGAVAARRLWSWMTRRHVEEITIRNDRDYPFPVVFEPWGDELILLPGEELKATFRSSLPGCTERLDQYNNELHADWHHPVLFAWPGALLSVWQDGKHVLEQLKPFPSIPGKGTREWMTDLGLFTPRPVSKRRSD